MIVSVGFLTNLRSLLDTPPDAISSAGGEELIRRKVRLCVCMGGKFPDGQFKDGGGEYNLRVDTRAAVRALSDWPTPVVFSVRDRRASSREGARAAPDQLARGLSSQGWRTARLGRDAVLYAVRGPELLDGVRPGLCLMHASLARATVDPDAAQGPPLPDRRCLRPTAPRHRGPDAAAPARPHPAAILEVESRDRYQGGSPPKPSSPPWTNFDWEETSLIMALVTRRLGGRSPLSPSCSGPDHTRWTAWCIDGRRPGGGIAADTRIPVTISGPEAIASENLKVSAGMSGFGSRRTTRPWT